MIFSSRVLLVTDGANRDSEVGYERRAVGRFETAAAVVPEPSTLWLGLVGCVARRKFLPAVCGPMPRLIPLPKA